MKFCTHIKSQVLVSFIIMMIIIGCDKKSSIKIYKISGSGEYIELNTSGSINPKTKFLKYFVNNNMWLFYGNTNLNELIIYKLPSGDIFKKIRYDYYGPNGIGSYRGSIIQNFDSIFIISGTYYNDLFLTDTSGRVRDKYHLSPVDGKNISPALMPIFSHINEEDIIYDKKLNLCTYVFTPFTNDKLFKETISIVYDIYNHKIINFNNFPKFEGHHRGSLDGYSRAYNGKEFIYSFGKHEDIFIQNQDGNYYSYSCKSKYQKRDLDWINDPKSPILEQQKRYIANPVYTSILYDKYRHLIYRFFLPGYNYDIHESIRKHLEYPDIFSIIILDERYRIVGETLLPAKTYDPYMTFITKDGLYIALHIDNPYYNPDSLAFERMNIIYL